MGNMCSDANTREEVTSYPVPPAPGTPATVPAPKEQEVAQNPLPALRRESCCDSERTMEWSEPAPRPDLNLDDYNIEPEGPITPARPPPPMLIECWLDATPNRSLAGSSNGNTICGSTNESQDEEEHFEYDDPSPSYKYEDNIRPWDSEMEGKKKKSRSILQIISAAFA